MISQIAIRYAQAFYDLSTEQKKVEIIYRELTALAELLESSPEMVKFFKSPVFLSSPRWNIIHDAFKKNLSKDTLNFLIFLTQKGRMSLLDEICRAFINLHRAHQGIVEATVTTSGDLTKQQTTAIRERLAQVLKKEVEAQVKVDAGLIGGVKVQIADHVYDFSLRTQLNKFKEKVIFA